MPDLYRLHIGPVNAAYYQRQFQRFESAGKATPSWNHGAAFFTLAWLLLRKLWRPAGFYAALLLATLALWWWGIHGRVPLAVEAPVCVVAALLLCVLPGLSGNALYYHHVRKSTLQTLTSATSLGQARVQLAEHAVTKERLQLVASIQALVALAVVFGVFFQPGNTGSDPAPLAAAAVAPSGPPDLVIPSVADLAPVDMPSWTPDVALPTPDPLAPASAPVEPAATASAKEIEAAPAIAATPSPDALSVVALAQSIPAHATSAPMAAPNPAPTEAVATPPAVVSAQSPNLIANTSPAPAKTPAAAPAKTVAAAAKPAAPAAAKAVAAAQAKPTTAAPARGKAEGTYYLNAGVYAQTANVDAAVKKLKAAKLNPIRQTVSSKNGELTRLRIGPFATRKQAEQAAVQARKLRIETSVVEPSKR